MPFFAAQVEAAQPPRRQVGGECRRLVTSSATAHCGIVAAQLQRPGRHARDRCGVMPRGLGGTRGAPADAAAPLIAFLRKVCARRCHPAARGCHASRAAFPKSERSPARSPRRRRELARCTDGPDRSDAPTPKSCCPAHARGRPSPHEPSAAAVQVEVASGSRCRVAVARRHRQPAAGSAATVQRHAPCRWFRRGAAAGSGRS